MSKEPTKEVGGIFDVAGGELLEDFFGGSVVVGAAAALRKAH